MTSARNPILRAGGALLASLLLVSHAVEADAHPLHTSLAQLTLDARARTVEISLRLFADDFARAAAQHGHLAPPSDSTVPESVARAYVAQAFVLAGERGEPVPLEWCGIRRAGELTWICMRARAASLTGVQVRDAIDVELYADQVNIVQGIAGGARQTVLFTRGDGFKRLK